MRLQRRNVLLFLDNVSSHPDIFLSNVKLIFLPTNTTTDCQPLDQGIIHSFKVHYKKLLMRSIVSSIDMRLRSNIMDSGEDLSRKITVLDSLGWIREAYDAVSIEKVQNCFAKCGFPVETVTEVQETVEIPGVPIPGDALDFINFDNNERTYLSLWCLLWYMVIAVAICWSLLWSLHLADISDHFVLFFSSVATCDHQTFSEWEDDYLNYLSNGGDASEY